MIEKMEKRILYLLVTVAIVSCVDLTQADLCEVKNSGYQVFIKDIKEDRNIGDVIGTIDFTGTKEQIKLRPADNDYFELDLDSREIRVKAKLDIETQGGRVTFQVSCSLKDFTSWVEIEIKILLVDVNDNAPEFSKDEYFLNVSEGIAVESTIKTGLKATDADPGFANGQILYEIVPGPYSEYFDIEDKLNTVMILKKPLDYETLRLMTIQVAAKDQPTDGTVLSSVIRLVITITDVDDHNPIFLEKNYRGTVNQNSLPGSIVNISTKIQAEDPDVTINSSMIYSLYDADDRFEIDSQTAEVKVKQTSTSGGEYTVMLEATQVDNPLRKGSAILKIIILDTETNAPKFERHGYFLSIPESTSIDTTIVTVYATDKDQEDTVTYNLTNGAGIFDLDKNSGALIIRNPLDFENKQKYNLSVTATDGTFTISNFVVISVTDVNDNNPDVTQPLETIAAERENGAIITRIRVTDKDNGSKVTFVLRTHKSLFSINAEGDVLISGQADELEETKYHLLIDVIDNGVPPRKESKVVIVEFPALPVTGAVVMANSDDTLAIIFGVLAAVMFVVVLMLVIYIIRKRQQSTEHLNKAKLNPSRDPKGLAFKSNPTIRTPSRINIDYHGNIDETSDGATTIQENPFNDDGLNFGYVHSDSETDRDMDEIQIETSVIPYDAYNTNKETYRNVDDHPSHKHYENGHLSTFKDSTDSINSESINSKKALVGGSNKRPAMHMMSWDNNGHVPSMQSMQSFDHDTEIPVDEKPEITVYF